MASTAQQAEPAEGVSFEEMLKLGVDLYALHSLESDLFTKYLYVQDWFFDMIIGFLRSPRWKTPVMSFIDEYCTGFDDEDEHKLEFTKIHNVSPPTKQLLKYTIIVPIANPTLFSTSLGLQKDS